MNIWQVQKINLKEKCKIALEKQFNENTSEKDISKMKVSFSSNSIIVEFWGSDDFGGKTLIVKWEAILDTSFNNQETIKWAKPYENDEDERHIFCFDYIFHKFSFKLYKIQDTFVLFFQNYLMHPSQISSSNLDCYQLIRHEL